MSKRPTKSGGWATSGGAAEGDGSCVAGEVDAAPPGGGEDGAFPGGPSEVDPDEPSEREHELASAAERRRQHAYATREAERMTCEACKPDAAARGARLLDGVAREMRVTPLQRASAMSNTMPAARSLSTRRMPIAVAGVSTPAAFGSSATSRARHMAASPSMRAVAP